MFGFFHSELYLVDSSMLMHIVVIYSFIFLLSIPLYEYTIIKKKQFWGHIWILPSLVLLCLMLLQIVLLMSFCELYVHFCWIYT